MHDRQWDIRWSGTGGAVLVGVGQEVPMGRGTGGAALVGQLHAAPEIPAPKTSGSHMSVT